MPSPYDFPPDESFFGGFEPIRIATGRGGARPNSGPKKGHKRAGADTPHEELTDYQRLERAKADKEEHLARKAKADADLEEGRVVDREAVRAAVAKAMSACSQALDAIPDHLERQTGLNPDQIELVERIINESKAKLADDLRKAWEQGKASENESEDETDEGFFDDLG